MPLMTGHAFLHLLNRLAWATMALLVLGIAGTGLYLVVERLRSERRDRPVARPLAELPTATAAVAPQPAGARTISGEVQRVAGQALVVRTPDGDTERVLIRSDAQLNFVVSTRGPQTLQPGEHVVVGPFVEQRDNTLVVMNVRATPALEQAPPDRCQQVGTVSAVEGNRLVYESLCGERRVILRRDVSVTRVSPARAESLRERQRVAVMGERLPDGTLAAQSVSILESQ